MKEKRSPCPVSATLEILGDKWTFLVVRDLFFGKKTYKAFQESPEKIPTNILAERLKRLELHEIIEKQPYQTKPVRYEYQLTTKGNDLLPVLLEMVKWGNRYIPDTYSLEDIKKIKARMDRAANAE